MYSNSNKVLIDTEGSGSLLYLPIDKLIQSGGSSGANDAMRRQGSQSTPVTPQPQQEASRERRTRQ